MAKKLLHLQGLRGVAILSVVAFHFFPKWFRNGYLGVDIFFLLSGYLMTMMLDRLETIWLPELADFWYRRMKRIVPLYYLATLGILLCLFLSNGMVQSANAGPAMNALLLATNLIRPSGDDGYFEKLGLAIDMFTHTWSLALEMQFYLIFPFIFVIFKGMPDRFAPLFVLATATSSLAYQMYFDAFTAFNSVFARIWQFLAGMAAFYAEAWFSPNERESDEKEDLIPDFTSFHRPTSETILLNIFILALVVLLLLPQDVNPLYARLNSILIAFVIVAYGRNCYLENRILVFIGEISYGWYLVHWPVYALFKVNELNDDYYLLWGAVLSLLISIILHYSFEKHYLGWSKTIIINVVVLLLLCNGIALQNLKASVDKPDEKILNGTVLSMGNESKRLDPTYFWPSDFLDKIVYGFENMTEKERYSLNYQYDSGDSKRTFAYCKNYTKTKNTKENRCHMNYHTNKTANQTILIIGNSWAGNLMQPVAESCSHKFSDMMTVFQTGCEPLIMSDQGGYYGCSQDHMFLDVIKEMKPDVLMMLVRYGDAAYLSGGTSPLNDKRFKAAAERMKEWQKYVKKRILILDAFPWPKKNLMPSVQAMLSGKNVSKEDYFSVDNRYLILKQRIARLVDKCEKCRVFDFATQFWFNGAFRLYEPKYKVSFMSTPFHLTPAGWIRVKPLLKYVCENA